MSTFIDGIGQCQVIDKSGEVVDLKGHDITSLAKTGTFTWEHQNNSPATLVGKILKAKKIFSKDDCENDRELHFWNKCKNPYLYVMGELLDDYTASAKECAGQMRYSKDNPDKAPILGFSIEGSEIPNTRKGQVITRSIARKVTLTQSPCNSACVAEIYEAPEQKSQVKDDFDEIFKTQEEAMTFFKSGEGEKMYTDFLAKKEAEGPSRGGKPPKNPYNEYANQGIRAGRNKSGKPVYSHGETGAYKFNPAEHQHQGEHHKRAIVTAQNPKLGVNKEGRAIAHKNATASNSRVENRAALSLNDKTKVGMEQGKQQVAKKEKFGGRHIGLTKNGQQVFSHADMSDYDFTPDEHREAAEHHRHAAVSATDAKQADHHIEQMKAHNHAALGKKIKKTDTSIVQTTSAPPPIPHHKDQDSFVSESISVGSPMGGFSESVGMGKSEKRCKLHKADKINEPVFTKVPGNKMNSGSPGIKSGMGTSNMGAKVREGNSGRAKEIANKQLTQIQNAPKPFLGKAESSGWSTGKASGDAAHFSHPEHGVVSVHKQPNGEFHVKHQGKLAGVGGVKGVFTGAKEAGAHAQKYMQAISQNKISAPQMHNRPSPQMPKMNKAIEAGSYNATPSTLTNGACYQTENMSRSQAPAGAEESGFHATKKNWAKQAKDDYERWPHREKFEKFMQARMPHLKLGEIQAIGRTLALKKNIDLEKSLEDLVFKK